MQIFKVWHPSRAFDDLTECGAFIFQGVKFSHDNLIAHLVRAPPLVIYIVLMILQDLDSDNILFNFLGGRTRPADTDSEAIGPFRSHFPIRYYINDFELAVCFDEDSDPATGKITGLPNVRAGSAHPTVFPTADIPIVLLSLSHQRCDD